MMAAFYNFIARFVVLFLPFLALIDNGVNRFYSSRKKNRLAHSFNIENDRFKVWMHCASLGEFEQGKPILTRIREKHPSSYIMLSFFSPSGFEEVRENDLIDKVIYMPLDTPGNAKRFVRKITPDLAIFVKYDFWYNHLNELIKNKIPTIYISVALQEKHFLFRSYGKFILDKLKELDRIFVQDQSTMDLLRRSAFDNLSLAGDTRVDSVMENVENSFHDPLIEEFIAGDKKVILAGSVWEQDVSLIAGLPEEVIGKYQWIFAPHEPDDLMEKLIIGSFGENRVLKYSKFIPGQEGNILLLDKKGILRFIYRFADLAFIGGGFSAGIHNTLEPAAYGLPVIFGPEYRKFIEASMLVDAGAFFSVRESEQMRKVLIELEDDENYINLKSIVEDYMLNNLGASKKVMDYLEQFWKG